MISVSLWYVSDLNPYLTLNTANSGTILIDLASDDKEFQSVEEEVHFLLPFRASIKCHYQVFIKVFFIAVYIIHSKLTKKELPRPQKNSKVRFRQTHVAYRHGEVHFLLVRIRKLSW